jgi:hypothetical protein
LFEKRNSFLRLLKNKGFKEESMTKVGLYAIDKSTSLESNKSLEQLSKAFDNCSKTTGTPKRDNAGSRVVSLDSVDEYEQAISEGTRCTLLMYDPRSSSGGSHGVHHMLLSLPARHA